MSALDLILIVVLLPGLLWLGIGSLTMKWRRRRRRQREILEYRNRNLPPINERRWRNHPDLFPDLKEDGQ